MTHEKKPLFRPENKTTIQTKYYIRRGGKHKHTRNTKEFKSFDGNRWKMHSKGNLGLDYTPLYNFLISSVGKNFDEVYAEACERMSGLGHNYKEEIFYCVEKNTYIENGNVYDSKGELVSCIWRSGESSYHDKMFIDDNGVLRLVREFNIDKNTDSDLKLGCACHTHSVNGQPQFYNYILKSDEYKPIVRFMKVGKKFGKKKRYGK